MLRGIFFATLCTALLALSPETRSAHADLSVIEAQWRGWQGAPGYGQEWEGREHCSRMRERLHEIRYRMHMLRHGSAIGWARGCTKFVNVCGMNVGVIGGKTNKMADPIGDREGRRSFSELLPGNKNKISEE
jgi:hypothetical protein